MAETNKVRASRDGDQFHYTWAARKCLQLLPGSSDLVAVTIEGASQDETESDNIAAGDEKIDVALYYGSESLSEARSIRYVQLKHSTHRSTEPWQASGLKETIQGFASRYEKLLVQMNTAEVSARFRFEFTTNRPVDPRLLEALQDLGESCCPRHPRIHKTLVGYTGLGDEAASDFFGLFRIDHGEDGLWDQRNLLRWDFRHYLPDADGDAPIRLNELVTKKAATEFEQNPSIRREDVLRALAVHEADLLPAPRTNEDEAESLPREQEQQILQTLLEAEHPLVIHADGGVGKSVLAARMAAAMPHGSVAVLYDCFGRGEYRQAFGLRHRLRDAYVQIANELAALGLCHPLIPSNRADVKRYARALHHRLTQAAGSLRSKDLSANLCIIIDAADNAEMAAEELGERGGSFVRDLIRMQPPEGVRLAFTCRTHRRWRLQAPPDAQEIALRPFSPAETAVHLRRKYPNATDEEADLFHYLSSANPRVQASALQGQQAITQMLEHLGPQPKSVEDTLGKLLGDAVARLRDEAGPLEAEQIDLICRGLAVLRPLVPVAVLARLSGTSEASIRSFVADLGRSLVLKGSGVLFLDEPSETWFQETFSPAPAQIAEFVDRLRPLAEESSYVAATIPRLLLDAGRLDELVSLALSDESLPTNNPLERRDVKLQRLTSALKASLDGRRHADAAKLALKAAGETAGKARQSALIEQNTDLAARLLSTDRIEEIVARRTFGSGWMGGHHAKHACLLLGHPEFQPEAESHLRMAWRWLNAWAQLSVEDQRKEAFEDEDRRALGMALLHLRGPKACASFLARWYWRGFAFTAGQDLAAQLIDSGDTERLAALAEAARCDTCMVLGLAAAAGEMGHQLPPGPVARLLRVIGRPELVLEESNSWADPFPVLSAVRASVEIALHQLPHQRETWAALIRRYLPEHPPRSLTERFGTGREPMLRAYALESALRGEPLRLMDLAPADVRKELEQPSRNYRSGDTTHFEREVQGLLPWANLWAQLVCGRRPADISETLATTEQESAKAVSEFREDSALENVQALLWLRTLIEAGPDASASIDAFSNWMQRLGPKLYDQTLIKLCRLAGRAAGFESLALDLAATAGESLSASRESAEVRGEAFVDLARAIFPVDQNEAGHLFNTAVEIASRIGDENLPRWYALLRLASVAADPENPNARLAYRLSRVAELTHEYVDRDKHFDWDATVGAMAGIDPVSALAIQARWRDRRFGNPDRLLPVLIYRLVRQGRLPPSTPIALAGISADWNLLADLKALLAKEPDQDIRNAAARITYRYLRGHTLKPDTWAELSELASAHGLEFPDTERVLSFSMPVTDDGEDGISPPRTPEPESKRDPPDWNALFEGMDLADPDALRAGYSAVGAFEPPFPFEQFFAQALERVGIGRRSEFVRAVAEWPDFGLFQLDYLLSALKHPWPRQLALRAAVRHAVLAACRHEPWRVIRDPFYALVPFRELDADGIAADRDVVEATLDGFAKQAGELAADALFQAIDPLASRLSSAQAADVLDFGCELLEEVLQPTDGDGPWRPDLAPTGSILHALAGYIWTGLGSPVGAERWQHAHVVRNIIELGWTDLLTEIAQWADAATAMPFVDGRFEFYLWHARQWLMIGLARGAMENPTALTSCIPLLLRCVKLEHVLIRGLAAETLQVLIGAGLTVPVDADELRNVNATMPDRSSSNWAILDSTETAMDGDGSDDDDVYGIWRTDIGPRWFAPIGRIFGLSQRAIERRAQVVIRERLLWSKSIDWRRDARIEKHIFKGSETLHSQGNLPRSDDLLAYQAYHAEMFIAADLLAERPAHRHPDSDRNEFHAWLSRYHLTRPDKQWLADGQDPRLVVDPPEPKRYDDPIWPWAMTAEYLDSKLVTDDGLTVLWGMWDGGTRNHWESVFVCSALVSRIGAESLVAALQTADDLDRFALPPASWDGNIEAGALSLRAWVMDRQETARLDEFDPWGKDLSYPGPAPSPDIAETLGLTLSANGRTWETRDGGHRLRRETWTHTRGWASDGATTPGTRLSGEPGFVRHLLDCYPDECIILRVSISRHVSRDYAGGDGWSGHAGRYIRYYLMEVDCVPRSL